MEGGSIHMEKVYEEIKEKLISGTISKEDLLDEVEDAYANKQLSTLRYHELIAFITND